MQQNDDDDNIVSWKIDNKACQFNFGQQILSSKQSFIRANKYNHIRSFKIDRPSLIH